MQSDAPGMQYGTVADPNQHDDDMAQPGMQVSPNLDDLPEGRRIEYWIAVATPNQAADIASVQVSVRDPSGNLHQPLPLEPRPCADLAAATGGATSLAAAAGTQQITAADDDLLARCYAGLIQAYSVASELSVADPPGEYVVESLLRDGTGQTDTTVSSFVNLAVTALEINFGLIDFGAVQPGSTQEAHAQLRDGTSVSTPAVRNSGNTGGYLSVRFGSMAGKRTGAIIDQFGATLADEQLGPVAAESEACFSQMIMPNESREVRFFVYPGAVEADSYRGTLTLDLRQQCSP
jgi:hypothetical protein